MKIYTKTGDRGTTSLFGGKRINKNSPRVAAYGAVDELNSLIGVVMAEVSRLDYTPGVGSRRRLENTPGVGIVLKKLTRIQQELFVLGADLATPREVKVESQSVKKSFITRLEREIDKWTSDLPPLRHFILPGGARAGSLLHLARSVARRGEREIVKLSSEEKINPHVLPYINRLSDWLFTLARYVNKIDHVKETPWRGRG